MWVSTYLNMNGNDFFFFNEQREVQKFQEFSLTFGTFLVLTLEACFVKTFIYFFFLTAVCLVADLSDGFILFLYSLSP